MVEGPKSAVFTTVRARDGELFHLDLHLERLARHASVLGIKIPDYKIPEGLNGLIKIQVDSNGIQFNTKEFYQEIHMDAEGITVPAPRWSRKFRGTKHGDWTTYREITSDILQQGFDVALLVHDFCIVDGDRVMPLVVDEDGTVWILSNNQYKNKILQIKSFDICNSLSGLLLKNIILFYNNEKNRRNIFFNDSVEHILFF